MIQLKTNKLFYGKWPYKVECRLRGANKITRYGHSDTVKWCLEHPGSKIHWHEDKNVDKQELLGFAMKIKKYLDKDDIQFRAENSHFNIYFKDNNTMLELEKDLKKWIYSVSKPESTDERNFLLDSGRSKILCDELPHKKYKFKILFNTKMPPESREKFFEWILKNGEKIKIAKSSMGWLNGTKKWVQDPFMYIDADSTLTMTLLYLGNNCKRVNEYIVRSSINTPCPH